MGAYGCAVPNEPAKARMMYTLAVEMLGRLDEFVEWNQRDDGTLKSSSVDVVRACLDVAIGMVWALNGQGFGDEELFDLGVATARMREHTESSRFWDDGGPEAGELVARVLSAVLAEGAGHG